MDTKDENIIRKVYNDYENYAIKFEPNIKIKKRLTLRQSFIIATASLLFALAIVLIVLCCTAKDVDKETKDIYAWIIGAFSTIIIGVISLVQGCVYKKEQDIYNQIKDYNEAYLKIDRMLSDADDFVKMILDKALLYQELQCIQNRIFELSTKILNVKTVVLNTPFMTEALIQRIDDIFIDSTAYLYDSIEKMKDAYIVKRIIDNSPKEIDESTNLPRTEKVFFEKLYNGCNTIAKSYKSINTLESFFFESHDETKKCIEQRYTEKEIQSFNQERLDFLNKLDEASKKTPLKKENFYYETPILKGLTVIY